MMRAAAAVFVKTPGLSPLKTRLAAVLGQDQAEAFYRLSCAAIEEVLSEANALAARYWAVAEAEAMDGLAWASSPCLWQGEGGLGERLHRIYSELIEKEGIALLLGADAPQLTPEILAEAVAQVRQGHFVIGPALDGGFYLFAGDQTLAPEVWQKVTYSSSQTRTQLIAALGPHASWVELEPLRDVDEIDDLFALRENWRENKPHRQKQLQLLDWCEVHLAPGAHPQ